MVKRPTRTLSLSTSLQVWNEGGVGSILEATGPQWAKLTSLRWPDKPVMAERCEIQKTRSEPDAVLPMLWQKALCEMRTLLTRYGRPTQHTARPLVRLVGWSVGRSGPVAGQHASNAFHAIRTSGSQPASQPAGVTVKRHGCRFRRAASSRRPGEPSLRKSIRELGYGSPSKDSTSWMGRKGGREGRFLKEKKKASFSRNAFGMNLTLSGDVSNSAHPKPWRRDSHGANGPLARSLARWVGLPAYVCHLCLLVFRFSISVDMCGSLRLRGIRGSASSQSAEPNWGMYRSAS